MSWNDRNMKPKHQVSNYAHTRRRAIKRLERDKAAFFANGGKVTVIKSMIACP